MSEQKEESDNKEGIIHIGPIFEEAEEDYGNYTSIQKLQVSFWVVFYRKLCSVINDQLYINNQGGGITSADIRCLRKAGFHTVESIVMTPKKNLALIKSLGEAKVETLIVSSPFLFAS